MLARRARARKNAALRDALSGCPPKSKKQPTQAAIAARAARQRTELRNRAQSPRAARNRVQRAGKRDPRNRRENRAQAKHTHSHKMPSNIPAAPKSQYEIERDERIKRNEAFMLSIGIDPHGGGYVLEQCINQILTSTPSTTGWFPRR